MYDPRIQRNLSPGLSKRAGPVRILMMVEYSIFYIGHERQPGDILLAIYAVSAPRGYRYRFSDVRAVVFLKLLRYILCQRVVVQQCTDHEILSLIL